MACTRIFSSFTAACLLLQGIPTLADADKGPMTLESIFVGTEYAFQELENIHWNEESSVFTYMRRNAKTGLLDIHEHEVRSGVDRPVVAGEKLAVGGTPVDMADYQWSPDRLRLLVSGPGTRTWDSIVEAPYYLYDVGDRSLEPLADGRRLRNVHLSPDGKHVGYVLENDLYVMDSGTGETTAVTTDGSSNVFNGIFDYGSTEFGFTDAWHWSPDSSKIAFWRLDASDVKVFYMIDELGKYNEVRPLKYPNTGERHAVNSIGVFDLQTGRTTWMDIGDNPDDYIPRIDWTPSSRTLAIQRLTRDHETLDVLFADIGTGTTKILLTEKDPAWIDITEDLMFLGDSERLAWTSEKSGYRHAYLYDYAGNETRLTGGDWEISSLIAVDEQDGWLYFYAKKDSFIDQHVYRVRLDGSGVEDSGVEKLSGKPGWYEWQFSPDRDYFIETYSSASTLPAISLRASPGTHVRTLVTNGPESLRRNEVPNPEFIKVETTDGTVLNAYMIKPPDFDPKRKYPVIAYGYGNAGSQMVVNRWGSSRGQQRDLWHRYMAQQGFLIFCLDNRTTAGRGKTAKNLTYGHYAKYAIHDQLEGVKFLRQLPWVDSSRIGFWGWSGGGYLAAALMTKGAPHYKTGVSVAPVIDLSRYQAVGVERWMDFPHENEEGYRQTNLLNYADKLEGDLLLIHGTGDENVKFAFTLQFADALIKANKQFDMLVYPNEHHGIENARLHVYTKIADYFEENL
jgi:dipeptidyl-peptidase-4